MESNINDNVSERPLSSVYCNQMVDVDTQYNES